MEEAEYTRVSERPSVTSSLLQSKGVSIWIKEKSKRKGEEEGGDSVKIELSTYL